MTIKTTGPNGDRPSETDLETTRAFVERSVAQIGINSGFFSRTAEVDLSNALSGNPRLLRDGAVLPGEGGDTTYSQPAIGHAGDVRRQGWRGQGAQSPLRWKGTGRRQRPGCRDQP